MEKSYFDRPMACQGLNSYRYAGRYGWIIIGAYDNDDAMREAGRSTRDELSPEKLQVWCVEKECYQAIKINQTNL